MRLPSWLFWFILLLIPLAFLLNLGLHPYIDDEGNRSLVAMEMLWSGNFVTPTMHGDYYYNKPPLWNWILALSFYLHGEASQWAARLPMVLCLFGFAATVYRTLREELGRERALLVAFMLLTCGRILLWESLLGLIDVCFSWVVYGLIMVIFRRGERKQWGRMFLFSYLLMVAAFMLKGLPGIVFQGLTLLTYLFLKKEWKRLFSLVHIGSGLLAVGLLAAYYAVYHQYNSLDNVFQALFVESGKRTAVAYGIFDTVKHVLNFPLELFYHFLPWPVLLLLLFKKENRQRLAGNFFFRFLAYAFFVNLAIYWLSPNFYPRYILMLLPLGFALLVGLLPPTVATKVGLERVLYYIYGVFILLLAIIPVVTIFVPGTQSLPLLYLRGGLPAMALLALLYYYWRQPEQYLFVLVAAFLLFRIGFNFLALPARAIDSSGQRIKTSSIEFSERWKGKDLNVFYNTHMEPAVSFYQAQHNGYITPRQNENLDTNSYYIYSLEQFDPSLFRNRVDSFAVRHSTYDYYYVGQLRVTDLADIESCKRRDRPAF